MTYDSPWNTLYPKVEIQQKTLKPLRINLNILLYKEDDYWIATCLEFDLCGDGDTQEKAWDNLALAIRNQIDKSIQFNNWDNLFLPADPGIFYQFAVGQDKNFRIPDCLKHISLFISITDVKFRENLT